MKILVTGAAGFIGFHTAKQLLERGDTVVGLDNFNDYYDVSLKESRAAVLDDYEDFSMARIDLANREAMESLFAKEKFDKVIHLAAQAGVRYSIENPHSYIESNIVGTLHILEGCRHNDVEHLTYASSSSVYGANTTMPFSIHQNVDHPLALYGATKKANELMAHTYSNLYGLPTTGPSTSATLPTSMTSLRVLFVRRTTRRSRMRTGTRQSRIRERAWPRIAFTISAISNPLS